MTRTRLPAGMSGASAVTAARAVPVDAPGSSPYVRATRRQVRTVSRSATRTLVKEPSSAKSSGRRLAPRPGRNRRPGSPPKITEPSASTATTRVASRFSRTAWRQPMKVPVLPTPMNSQSGTPNPSRTSAMVWRWWARALAGLRYWLSQTRPGVLRSRSSIRSMRVWR